MSAGRPYEKQFAFHLSSLREALRAARINAGFSLRDLSARCGVSVSQLQRMESVDSDYSIRTLFPVTQSLGLPVWDVIMVATRRNRTIEVYSFKTVPELVSFCRERWNNEQEIAEKLDVLEYRIQQIWVLCMYFIHGFRYDSLNIVNWRLGDKTRERLKWVRGEAETFDNVQRLNAADDLCRDPVQKLRSWHLLDSEVFAEIEQLGHRWPAPLPSPASVIKTMHRAAHDQTFPADKSTRIELDDTSDNRNSEGVIFELDRLLETVRKLTKGKGKKAALAGFLGVSQARVSEWLAGKYQPNGATTLRLSKWVIDQQSKQKQKP